jgi:hypothetical protein
MVTAPKTQLLCLPPFHDREVHKSNPYSAAAVLDSGTCRAEVQPKDVDTSGRCIIDRVRKRKGMKGLHCRKHTYKR